MSDPCPDWSAEFGFTGGLPATLDYQALLDGLAWGGYLADRAVDQDAIAAEEAAEAEAVADGRMRPADPAWVAALAVEHMEAGPALAGWLEVAAGGSDRLDENALAALAIGAQKLASRAQAAELAAAARITSRAAAADRRIGVAADGRPARLCQDAISQIALALTLTDHSAGAWADLAVGLGWRLTATRRALTAGAIDYSRARVIWECTSVLSPEAAQRVEAKLLPDAGRLTVAELRQRLRLAVIAADPQGAEERRKAAEKHADVRLYGEDDQTATLVADKLPQVEAAAGFARVTALARARMAAGSPGGLRLNRVQVLLGMMLGSLPLIPPAEGAPPDEPPTDDAGGDEPPSDEPPSDEPPSDEPPSDDAGGSGPGYGCPGGGLDGGGPGDDGGGPGDDGGGSRDDGRGSGDDGRLPPEDLPDPRDEDAPPDDGLDDAPETGEGADGSPDRAWDVDEDLFGTGPAPVWPSLGAIPPGLGHPARPAGVAGGRPVPDGRPVPGLLDVLVPWATLAGLADRPGLLGRIGPITPVQARHLAMAAEADPRAQWRVIVTNAAGQAITVTRIRRRTSYPRASRDRRGARDGPGRADSGRGGADYGRGGGDYGRGRARRGRPPPGSGLVSRLTLTITQDTLREQAQALRQGSGPSPPAGMTAAAVKAAARALGRALAQAEADAAAGGCAHHGQSAGYRPPPRLREQVIARDVTCRGPVCRQPAWRSDLDHTIAYEKGGRTCRCNIGGACRRDHQLKQHPRWKLEQTRPGYFTWTTPAGRTYTVGPDINPV